MIQFVFNVWQVEGYWNILKLSWDHLLSPHIKPFWKIKKSLELDFLPHLLHNFWRKIFLLTCSINWPNFIAWLPLLSEILDNIWIAIVCKPGCDVMNFEADLIFLIKPFFVRPKSRDKNLNILRTKRAFKMK